MLQGLLQLDQHVQRGNLPQIQRRVTVQHFVVEAQIVKPDYQVGALQLGDEVVHLAFAIDSVVAPCRAVGHADAHPHPADLVPAADFLGRLLRFQIEIDDVSHDHATRSPCAHLFTGVRPCSAAATSARSSAPDNPKAVLLSSVSAPEDRRTPQSTYSCAWPNSIGTFSPRKRKT